MESVPHIVVKFGTVFLFTASVADKFGSVGTAIPSKGVPEVFAVISVQDEPDTVVKSHEKIRFKKSVSLEPNVPVITITPPVLTQLSKDALDATGKKAVLLGS